MNNDNFTYITVWDHLGQKLQINFFFWVTSVVVLFKTAVLYTCRVAVFERQNC